MSLQIVIANSTKLGFALLYECDKCHKPVSQSFVWFPIAINMNHQGKSCAICPFCKTTVLIDFSCVNMWCDYYTFTSLS